jgi:type IV pilus assembly protein PilN
MRFTINLATQSYLDKRLLNQVCFCVIALLVLLLGWNVMRASWNQGEKRKLNEEIFVFEGRLNNKPGGVPEKDFTRQQAQISFYNEIVDRKSINWLQLLELIESVTPEGIAMSAVTPGKKKGELELEGRARSFGVIRQYLEKVEASQNFTNVLLLSHQELMVGETGRGVQFKISCQVQF